MVQHTGKVLVRGEGGRAKYKVECAAGDGEEGSVQDAHVGSLIHSLLVYAAQRGINLTKPMWDGTPEDLAKVEELFTVAIEQLTAERGSADEEEGENTESA